VAEVPRGKLDDAVAEHVVTGPRLEGEKAAAAQAEANGELDEWKTASSTTTDATGGETDSGDAIVGAGEESKAEEATEEGDGDEAASETEEEAKEEGDGDEAASETEEEAKEEGDGDEAASETEEEAKEEGDGDEAASETEEESEGEEAATDADADVGESSPTDDVDREVEEAEREAEAAERELRETEATGSGEEEGEQDTASAESEGPASGTRSNTSPEAGSGASASSSDQSATASAPSGSAPTEQGGLSATRDELERAVAERVGESAGAEEREEESAEGATDAAAAGPTAERGDGDGMAESSGTAVADASATPAASAGVKGELRVSSREPVVSVCWATCGRETGLGWSSAAAEEVSDDGGVGEASDPDRFLFCMWRCMEDKEGAHWSRATRSCLGRCEPLDEPGPYVSCMRGCLPSARKQQPPVPPVWGGEPREVNVPMRDAENWTDSMDDGDED